MFNKNYVIGEFGFFECVICYFYSYSYRVSVKESIKVVFNVVV